MDSGTPLDIVAESSIDGYEDLVKPIEPIILDTANGESLANRGIDLRIGCLGEDIVPYVLESSPDVLSIGRRCVLLGYGWYWPPFSLEPYLVHPTTGEHIVMRVEDFCPYLDDPGSTFPADLSTHATSVCCVIRRPAAPAAFTHRAKAAPGSSPSSSSAKPGVPQQPPQQASAVPPQQASADPPQQPQ